MNSVGLVIMLIAIVGTAIEGGSCLLSERRPLSVGFLNLGLCSLLVSYAYLLRSGCIVIAPEFGMVMVQGTAATWFLRVAQVIIALLPIPCWQRIAELHTEADKPAEPGDRHPRWWIPVLIALAIGTWSATRIVLLNPGDIESLRVSALDVWWPPLVIWLAVCLANIMLELARNEVPTADFALAAALTAPMARFALVHQELFDSNSKHLWNFVEPVCLITAISLAPRSFSELRLKWDRRASAVLIVLLVVVLVVFYTGSSQVKWAIDLMPPLTLVGVVLTRIMVHSLRPPSAVPEEFTRESASANSRLVVRVASERISGIVFAASVLIIPICLIDLLSVGYLPRNVDLVILTIFWLSFSARLAEGVFTTLPTLFKNGALYFPVFKTAWTVVGKGAKGASDSLVGAMKSFSSGSKWAVAFRTVALTLFALLALVAVGEMLNYDKLVVEPFEWKGSDKDDLRVSDRVSAGVVNTLGEMRRELLPVLQVSSHSAKHDTEIEAAILDNGALAGAIAKSSDLKLTPSVDIPLPLITSPIQRLVQWAFNIRVVRGSLHKTAEGKHYLTLIESDRGDTWKVYGDIPTGKPSQPARPVIAAAGAEGQVASGTDNTTTVEANPTTGRSSRETVNSEADSTMGPSSSDDRPVCEVAHDSGVANNGDAMGDQLDDLIDEAAFRIASGDPAFIALGLTENWKAYRYFRTGLQYWNCYQAHQRWSDLQSAIAEYQKAVAEDQKFAPALYRLGLAFQGAGEPDIAIQAFRNALSANPAMIQARIAEAQALSAYPYNDSNLPAIVPPPQPMDHSGEARQLWADIIPQSSGEGNRLNLLPAYFALCLDNYDWNSADQRHPNKHYLTYFYCSRALATFYRLPRIGRNEPTQRKLEANILMILGETLLLHDEKDHPVPGTEPTAQRPWVCWLDSYALTEPRSASYSLHGSTLTAHALRYFRQSLAIVPDDDSALCDEASANLYLAQTRDEAVTATAKLIASSSAHVALANGFLQRARQAARGSKDFPTPEGMSLEEQKQFLSKLSGDYFGLSFDELAEARKLSPSNPDILNSYADTAWVWWLSAKNDSLFAPPTMPSHETLQSAEEAARKAGRLFRLRADSDMEVIARDTLVETLIALGRNEEAVDLLHHPGMLFRAKQDIEGAGEIEWDYAQAAVCASENADHDQSQELIADAESKFSDIRHYELRREERPFTDTPGALSLSKARSRCAVPPDQIQVPEERAEFHGPPIASSQPGCSSMVPVDVKLNGNIESADGSEMALRVWGNGAEDSFRPDQMSIELAPPSHLHRVYFAQLVQVKSGGDEPLSRVITFDVPEEKSCAKGHLTLNFQASAAGLARKKLAESQRQDSDAVAER